MADKNTAGSATDSAGESSATDDNSDDKTPATGAGTKSVTDDSSSDDSSDEWTPPTREDWEATQASIKKLEAAQKKANKEAEERRKALTDAEKAKMTEDEQAKARAAELEAENEALKVQVAEAAIYREVTRLTPVLGIIDPDAVVRMLDWDGVNFEDGKPADGEVEREVKRLLQSKPYLVGKAGDIPPRRTGNNAADATSGSGPKPNLTAEELKAANDAGMAPEQYEALKKLKKGATLKDWQATRPQAGAAGGTR